MLLIWTTAPTTTTKSPPPTLATSRAARWPARRMGRRQRRSRCDRGRRADHRQARRPWQAAWLGHRPSRYSSSIPIPGFEEMQKRTGKGAQAAAAAAAPADDAEWRRLFSGEEAPSHCRGRLAGSQPCGDGQARSQWERQGWQG